MYGLKQSDIISYNQIISHMEPRGYYTVTFKTVLWAQGEKNKVLPLCG